MKQTNKIMQSKAKILSEISGNYQDLLEGELMNEPCITPKEAFEAMQKYGEQIAGEIKKFNEAGERRFSLEEIKDAFISSRLLTNSLDNDSDPLYRNYRQYFKEKFGIDLEK